MANMDRLTQFRAEVFQELTGNILPFWMQFATDREHGGFYGYVANDRTAHKEAPKGLVQHGRALWTFAHAYRLLGDPDYSLAASHARKALMDWFWDREHGGFFWMVDYRGRPLQTDKFIYGQAFAIYGLAEHYLSGGNSQCLDRAIELYRLVERHSRDPEQGGYWEVCRRDWTPSPGQHVDETDLPVDKGMNTNLHVLEAYTNLLRVWDDDGLRAGLQALAQTTMRHIVNPDTHHLSMFFDREWRSLSDRVSYGHDIEASWLLVEAAEVVGDAGLLASAKETALQMAYTALEQAVDADGGLCYEGDPSGVTERSKIWWPQSEAVIGFLNAYQVNEDPHFLDASLSAWRFIQEHLVDREQGEWFQSADEVDRRPDREKAGLWKAPYHNGRVCMEVMERLRKLTGA